MNINSKFLANQNQAPQFFLQQLQQGQQQQQQQQHGQQTQQPQQHQQQQQPSQPSQQQQQQFTNDLFVPQQQGQPSSLQNNDQLNASNILAQTLYQGQYGRATSHPPQSQAQQHAQQQMQLFSQQLQQAQQSQPQTQSQQLLPSLQQQQQQQQQLLLPQQSTQFQSINLDNTTNTSPYWKIQVTLCQASRNANSIPHYWAKIAASSNKKSTTKAINGNPYVEQSPKQPSLIDITNNLITNAESEDVSTPVHENALLQHKKLSNDSVTDEEEQRIRLKENDKQWWTGLDLSGQQIMYLSTKLFNYKFLNKLYLNGNKLQSIPSSIGKLKNLKYLDVSNNLLKQLPKELGTLFHLKYLYAFDNNLTSIPFEFGKLFELDFLGVEGNPSMDQEIISILAKKGTRGLTIYLRDNTPKSEPPREREWLYLSDQGDRVTEEEAIEDLHYVPKNENDPNGFTVMTFNTLCQHYATPKMYRYTPSWALEWEYRRNLLTEQVLQYKTDLVCLQEVETRTYEEYWVPLMKQQGYSGTFGCKTRAKTMGEKAAKKVDGCATFYKTSKFDLLEFKVLEYSETVMREEKYEKTPDLFNRFANKDNIAGISILKHKETNQKIALANTHLHWDPELNDVKAMQICVLLEELQFLLHKSNSKNCSILICGDFNSQTDSAVYELLSTGAVAQHADLEGKNYGRFTNEGFQHQFNLKSAYSSIGELPFTNLTPLFTDCIDYIWFSNSSLQVRGLLDKVDPAYASQSVGFPDPHFPSDHIMLVAKLDFKKNATLKISKGADFGRMGSRRT